MNRINTGKKENKKVYFDCIDDNHLNSILPDYFEKKEK